MSNKGEVEVQKLACKLTPSEREAKTAELVRLEQDEAHQKAHKKETVAGLNAGLKLVRASIDQVVKELHEGEEQREVEVESVYDYEAKVVRFKRRDTGEQIFERKMDAHDLQQPLPDQDLLPPPQQPQKRRKRKHGELTDVDPTALPEPGAMKAPAEGKNFRNATT